MTLNSTGIY